MSGLLRCLQLTGQVSRARVAGNGFPAALLHSRAIYRPAASFHSQPPRPTTPKTHVPSPKDPSTEQRKPYRVQEPNFLGEELEIAPIEFTSGEEVKFMDLSTGGAEIVLGYQDVGEKSGRAILAIHDTPGYSEDFKNLFEPLTARGYRVIAPNIPGYGVSHSSKGIHDADMNLEVVLDLLTKLGVSSVDAVVSEGSGCILACAVLAKTELARSLVVLNPSGFAPLSADQWYGHLKANPHTGPVLNATEPHGDLRLRRENILPLISALNSEAATVYDDVRGLAEQVGRKGVPVLAITASDDLLSTTTDVIAFAKSCGVDDTRVVYADARQGAPDEPPQSTALVLNTGGHRTLNSHPGVVSKHVIWLLEAMKDQAKPN